MQGHQPGIEAGYPADGILFAQRATTGAGSRASPLISDPMAVGWKPSGIPAAIAPPVGTVSELIGLSHLARRSARSSVRCAQVITT
jgi:hypothetical protein